MVNGEIAVRHIKGMIREIWALNYQNCNKYIARVFRVGSSLPTKDGNTAHKFKVADKTGSVDLTVWNEVGEAINCGDIIRLTKG